LYALLKDIFIMTIYWCTHVGNVESLLKSFCSKLHDYFDTITNAETEVVINEIIGRNESIIHINHKSDAKKLLLNLSKTHEI